MENLSDERTGNLDIQIELDRKLWHVYFMTKEHWKEYLNSLLMCWGHTISLVKANKVSQKKKNDS